MPLVAAAQVDLLTNAVPIITNLVFRLDAWSDSGRAPRTQFGADEILYRVLSNLGGVSNHAVHYLQLPGRASIECKLFDNEGKEVPKTKVGLEWSQPLPVINNAQKFFSCKPQALFGDDMRKLFSPAEAFAITNKGFYTMEVRIRMLLPMTNGVPDAAMMNNDREFAFVPSQNCGIFVSSPVRVRIKR